LKKNEDLKQVKNNLKKKIEEERKGFFKKGSKLNKYLRYLLFFLMLLILFGIFILAAPGILGEKPVSIDTSHFERYPVYKMNEQGDHIIFLLDKNGERTQVQIERENIKFFTDFDLETPTLYVFNPEYVVYKNIFYKRKKEMSKTDKEFKKALKYLNRRKKEFYLIKFVDNE